MRPYGRTGEHEIDLGLERTEATSRQAEPPHAALRQRAIGVIRPTPAAAFLRDRVANQDQPHTGS